MSQSHETPRNTYSSPEEAHEHHMQLIKNLEQEKLRVIEKFKKRQEYVNSMHLPTKMFNIIFEGIENDVDVQDCLFAHIAKTGEYNKISIIRGTQYIDIVYFDYFSTNKFKKMLQDIVAKNDVTTEELIDSLHTHKCEYRVIENGPFKNWRLRTETQGTFALVRGLTMYLQKPFSYSDITTWF